MGAHGAVEVLFRKEIAKSGGKDQKVEENESKFLNPSRAAERGYVDAVIRPGDTRIKLFRHLRSHLAKSEERVPKRNGIIPT